jgi:cell division protein FtsB
VGIGPWGKRPPRKPRVGAGRAALAKRAKVRGGGEQRAAQAARRALTRGRKRRKSRGLQLSRWGPAAELLRFSRVFEQKFLNRQRLRHLVVALAGVWLAWTFLIGDASLPRLWSVERENAALEAEIEKLTRHEERLAADVKALENPRDKRALELVARDEHALVRDGEKLVRFYEEPDSLPKD